jgi:hypothetical protein
VPTTRPADPPATTQAPPAGELTVTGTVIEGVEPGCLLLDAEGGQRYLLVGGDRAELRAGSRVAVTGRVERDLLSTCQQGEPLVVSAIEPAPSPAGSPPSGEARLGRGQSCGPAGCVMI